MENIPLFSYEADIRAASREEGEQKGRREGKLEAAKTMLDMGFKLSDIEKVTKLSMSEIEKLMQ